MLTINLKSGRRIVVDYDEAAQNPRREFGAETRLLIFPNRYFEGDETKDWPGFAGRRTIAFAAFTRITQKTPPRMLPLIALT